jgi:hypothetical protein
VAKVIRPPVTFTKKIFSHEEDILAFGKHFKRRSRPAHWRARALKIVDQHLEVSKRRAGRADALENLQVSRFVILFCSWRT